MTYIAIRPEPGETLISLALALGAPVICHWRVFDALLAAGVPARKLARGGPLFGELWVEVAA